MAHVVCNQATKISEFYLLSIGSVLFLHVVQLFDTIKGH